MPSSELILAYIFNYSMVDTSLLFSYYYYITTPPCICFFGMESDIVSSEGVPTLVGDELGRAGGVLEEQGGNRGGGFGVCGSCIIHFCLIYYP